MLIDIVSSFFFFGFSQAFAYIRISSVRFPSLSRPAHAHLTLPLFLLSRPLPSHTRYADTRVAAIAFAVALMFAFALRTCYERYDMIF